MAAAKVDIDMCTLFLYPFKLPQSMHQLQLPPTHIHAQNLVGPCIHSVHSGTCFPLYMAFPRPHHQNSHLLLLVDGWLYKRVMPVDSCSQSGLHQPLLAESHGLHMGSCDRVPSLLLYIILKSPCNQLQLIVYEWCRMTYSWNDLHRRRWSLGDEATVWYMYTYSVWWLVVGPDTYCVSCYVINGHVNIHWCVCD